MRPAFVLDCSVTLAWCFKDERTPATDALQDRLIIESALVPEHWCLEVANGLAVGERRKRIAAASVAPFVQLLGTLQIEVDDQLAERTFDHILPLARSHSLTAYDAAYLDLAIRRQLPLATLDEDVRRAATALGVPVLGK
jgi:predicted nucleic acid-binding protein